MQHNTIHLFNRFGFGISEKEKNQNSRFDFARYLENEQLELLDLKINFPTQKPRKGAGGGKALREKAQQGLNQLRASFFQKMLTSPNVVHEKMSLFWHHHFACAIKNPRHALLFSNAIRKHSLGNFRDLLLAVSQSAAMINYLHTRQNRKRSPNEDFARELCELFTLGRDTVYTEKDIQEIARCFTGWSHNFAGAFQFEVHRHDTDSKTIFGQTGNFDGEAAIGLILEKRACAAFICRNIYEYFVHPTADEKRIAELTEVFYTSNYDIKKLVTHIATSDWFYAPQNQMVKIKSPIELIVGLGRQFKLHSDNPKAWAIFQRFYDQILYKPRNVEGWKVNREWIDSNSLPKRLRLPSLLLTGGQINLPSKPDYDSNPNAMAGKQNKLAKRLAFNCDWDYFFSQNPSGNYRELFFNNQLSPQANRMLQTIRFGSPKEEVIQLLSLPEYQLC